MKTEDKVYRAITDYLAVYSVPPTMREIGEIVGLVSVSNVSHHVRNLIKKGRLYAPIPGASLSRNVGIPGGQYVLPVGIPLLMPEWEIVVLKANETDIWYIRFDGEVFESVNFAVAMSWLLTKIVHNMPSYVPLRHMVRLPEWIIEQLDKVGYTDSDQASEAGVSPYGKASENERAWIREEHGDQVAQGVSASET